MCECVLQFADVVYDVPDNLQLGHFTVFRHERNQVLEFRQVHLNLWIIFTFPMPRAYATISNGRNRGTSSTYSCDSLHLFQMLFQISAQMRQLSIAHNSAEYLTSPRKITEYITLYFMHTLEGFFTSDFFNSPVMSIVEHKPAIERVQLFHKIDFQWRLFSLKLNSPSYDWN